ncbi:hypothetical protein, partial [Salmonella enterica]|uniref:hypothetical protein n=1 Tax=Salmonella enterica TaxID=28901 RepID=UPI00329A62FE
FDEPFFHELEHGNERHGDAHAAFFGLEQPNKLHECGLAQRAQDVRHPLTDGEACALNMRMGEQLRTLDHVSESEQ